MNLAIPDGIPLEKDYRTLLLSELFQTMEAFSDRFILTRRGRPASYKYRWGADPLHHWSRQWEYPFVYEKIRSFASKNPDLSILDAGSGFTFFPFYLASQFEGAKIYCCDNNRTLVKAFHQRNRINCSDVHFSMADLKSLNYESEQFDMIYCISVLEHTDGYDRVVREFHRILKPGGQLVVTFDISLDGARDIPVAEAITLVESFTKYFRVSDERAADINTQIAQPDILTSLLVKTIDASLLPWKFPKWMYKVKSLFEHGHAGIWPPNLTICCLCLNKISG